MTRNRLVVSVLFGLGLIACPSSAQVRISPESPRWGETITVTADPSVWSDQTQRFYKSDQLYVILLTNITAGGARGGGSGRQ